MSTENRSSSMPYQLFIAWRYLRARRSQKVLSIISAISALGITVGVWALVSVLAFQSGMEHELRTKILGGTSHLNLLRKADLPIENPSALIEKIAQVRHVKSAAATSYHTVLLSGPQHPAMGILKSVDLTGSVQGIELYQTLIPGGNIGHLRRTQYPDGSEFPGVILGKQLAEDLNVRVGEVLQIVTPGDKGDLTPVGILPRSFTLKVVGLFESGLYEYDSAWGYIALETAQELTGEAQSARVIQIMLDDIYQVKEVAAAVQIIAGPEFVTNDWQELNQPAFAALNLQRLGFAVGISLIILVAALNIVTTLIMLVVEKKRDIAILTAMGATSGDILVIFMIQGVVIGAVGTLVGGMCGAVTAIVGDKYRLIQLDPRTYSISYVPFRFSASDTVLVLLIAMGISFFATLYPAWQASRLDPVEGIRQG